MPTRSWTSLLDDAGASGGSFDPLPEGDYDFTISFAEAKSINGGKMVYATKNVVETGAYAGHVVWHEHTVTPSNPVALKQLFRAMDVIGLSIDYFASDPSDHQVAAKLVDQRFRGQVIVRTRRGQESNEIVQFFSSHDRTSSTPDESPAFYGSTAGSSSGSARPRLEDAPEGPEAPKPVAASKLAPPTRDDTPLVVSKPSV